MRFEILVEMIRPRRFKIFTSMMATKHLGVKMPDAGQEVRQTTDGVGDISDARESIEDAVKDPFAFAVVLATTGANALLLGALDYFQAQWDTLVWLIIMVMIVLGITVIACHFLGERKRRALSKRQIRKWFRIVGPAVALALSTIWVLFYFDSRATIESVAGISSPGFNCSGELPKIDLVDPPTAPYCLPVLQTGGSERKVEGTVGGRVSGDLWLEVHTPTQRWSTSDLPEQSIQEKPQWFYSPVIEEKSGWRAYPTIGIQSDSTPKLHYVRLIACTSDATDRILAKSYRVSPSAGQEEQYDRHTFPWGNRCQKEFDAVPVLFQPDSGKQAEWIDNRKQKIEDQKDPSGHSD